MVCLIRDVRSGSGDYNRLRLLGQVFIGLTPMSKRSSSARDTGMKRSLFQWMECLNDVRYLEYSPVTFESKKDRAIDYFLLSVTEKNQY